MLVINNSDGTQRIFDNEPVAVLNNKKSTHRCEVVEISPRPHPNADKLSIVPVDGYTVCIRTEDWVGITKGVFIPPDSIVKISHPSFAFLAGEAKGDGTVRIRVKKLRGIVSYGLLIPVPAPSVIGFEVKVGDPLCSREIKVGDDLAKELEVEHYDAEASIAGAKTNSPFFGDNEGGLPFIGKYDIDAFQAFAHKVFIEGEPLVITEKVHGCNSRYVFTNGRMWCGSRSSWKKEFATPNYNIEAITQRMLEAGRAQHEVDETVAKLQAKKNAPQTRNLWWQALENTPEIKTFCEAHPGFTVYGEVYGQVQKGYAYGLKPGVSKVIVFDIQDETGRWLNPLEARKVGVSLPWVPIISAAEPYNFNNLLAMAEGPSLMLGATNIKEGIVMEPLTVRYHDRLGRVKLKIVSAEFLGKQK